MNPIKYSMTGTAWVKC